MPASQIKAQTNDPITIREYRGTEVYFPSGLSSFADDVVEVTPGRPEPTTLREPRSALGPPDWNISDEKARTMTTYPDLAYTLGCAGSAIYQFADNALIDVPGPDLYVFEVGRNVEPTSLAVSNDLSDWQDVGSIGGALVEIDLADYGLEDRIFRYVKLTDLRSDCRLPTPGADIDAIGAIGSAERMSFSAEALFDVGSSALRTDAQSDLEIAFLQLKERMFRRILIVGHTDATGSSESNLRLGMDRASAVQSVVLAKAPAFAGIVDVETRGEAEPIASNETPLGRAKNRRVEIVLIE